MEFQYFLISLAKVFVDPEDKMRIKVSDNARRRYLHSARTTMDALVEMEMITHVKVQADKPKRIKVSGRFRRRFEVVA